MLQDEWQRVAKKALTERGLEFDAEAVRKLYTVANQIYMSRKLDSVATGPNRHLHFARFFVEHKELIGRFRRIQNRRIGQEVRALKRKQFDLELELGAVRFL